jgi:hypothetical protein
VIKKKAINAINILDRYHVMALMSKAIDKVRAEESKQMKADGLEPLLTNSRFILLKRPENPTEKQEIKLAELVQYNLRSIRAYLLKEDFQQFWTYISPYYTGKFLDAWCTRTMRSKIDLMKKMAKTLRKHRPLLMNWFKARGELSSGVVEGFNLLYSSTDVIIASWVNFDQAKSKSYRIGLNTTLISTNNRDFTAQRSQAAKFQAKLVVAGRVAGDINRSD